MVDFNTLLEFSHHHCVAICAVLVPVNLLATLQTVILTGLNRPPREQWSAIAVASLAALLMVLHVMSWFIVGVIMVQTFVLWSLGAVCLSINLWSFFHPQSLRGMLAWLGRSLQLPDSWQIQ
jgi:prepilin signal peptidase PulO-like enzyme (type II secretory pathway)